MVEKSHLKVYGGGMITEFVVGGGLMLTGIGRFLRKLRIDHGEILKDMAEKLGVTVSFLSAVENGKKKMPSIWNQKICNLYCLDARQKEEFTAAIADTERSVEMVFDNITMERRELAVSFARKFSELDDVQVEEIRKILQGENGRQ